jgi:hypothetical protein
LGFNNCVEKEKFDFEKNIKITHKPPKSPLEKKNIFLHEKKNSKP